MGDPRVFFSSERTLLAWIRTGLTIIALGFVVARLHAAGMANGADSPQDPLESALPKLLGIALVVIGALAILVATWQHRSFTATLPAEDLPAKYGRFAVFVLAYGTAFVGLLVAIYLWQ